MKQRFHFFWSISRVTFFYCIFTTYPTHAQIVPDVTLPNNSIVTTQDDVSTITGGTLAGSNLFHSFESFSVPTGSTASFNNSLDVQNIFTRVTGLPASKINGLIQANGNTNLFLINPNGIIFAPNASLNIGGSFIASTANSVNFADGIQFSATNSQAKSLLTLSVPLGLQFGRTAKGILVQGSSLEVQPSKTLGLVGGDLTLEAAQLKTRGGRIELGSIAGSSLVNLSQTEKGWFLGYEGIQNFQNIQLTQGNLSELEFPSFVDATGEGGGDIQVQGRRVTLTEGSQLQATTTGGGLGGSITVTASESIELIGTSPFSTSGIFTASFATGKAGEIKINTRKLTVRDRATISTEVAEVNSEEFIPSSRQGGDLTIIAPESVELVNGFLLTRTLGVGDAGDLKINTGNLIVRDRATVAVSSQGAGSAGNLEVTARSIRLDNEGGLTATSTAGRGGGNITLNNKDLLLLRGNSEISTNAQGIGNGGNIDIETDILVGIENSDITATAVRGQGGNIHINAQGIFGIEPRSKRTSESDITASSELGINGVVEINRPDIDPSAELVILPAEPVDISGLIAQGCSAGGSNVARSSEFVVTGRGGLPPTPEEALRSDSALADLGTPVQTQDNRSRAAISSNPTSASLTPLVEAQGLVIGSKGEVILTTQAPTVTIDVPWLKPTICNAS